METTVTKQQLKIYLIIGLVAGLVGVVLMIILGYFEIFIGAIQFVFALGKSILQLYRNKTISENIKIYWKIVLIYFLVMALIFFILEGLVPNEYRHWQLYVWMYYCSTAWGIAVFHFKHIMFPKKAK